jgi:hypothetical protein
MVPRSDNWLFKRPRLVGWWCAVALCLGASLPARAQTVPRAATVGAQTSADSFMLHVVATEEFLNRLTARREVQPGPVHETIDDVVVEGEQCTITDLRLDLLPCLDHAHAQLVLLGDVQSRTTGYTDQAAIHSVGHQQFRAAKDVFFDGDTFSTRHPTISVQVQSQNLGIQTPLDGTIFGGVAGRIGMQLADQRAPHMEERIRQRVSDRVLPTFNAQTDQELGNANARLESEFRQLLRRYNLLPSAQRVVTTDRHLHYAAAFGKDGSGLALPPPRADLISAHALNLYLHESALNGLLDRLKLHGWKTTDHELHARTTEFRTLIGGGSPRAPHGLPGGLATEIEFDRDRPIWAELAEERLTMRVRAALRPAGQDILPPVEIVIPMRLVARGTDWQLEVGQVDVQTTDPSNRLTDVAADLIRDAITASLPEPRLPRALDIPNWPADKSKLQLSGFRAADGWLAVSID